MLQILGYRRELLQRRLQIIGDFLGNDLRGRQVGGFFQGIVFQPEDVEVHLVALLKFLVVVRTPSPLR